LLQWTSRTLRAFGHRSARRLLLANDEESHLKEASCADKKTCSRSIGLSQRRCIHFCCIILQAFRQA